MTILTCYAKGKTFRNSKLLLEPDPEAAGGGGWSV